MNIANDAKSSDDEADDDDGSGDDNDAAEADLQAEAEDEFSVFEDDFNQKVFASPTFKHTFNFSGPKGLAL